MPASHLNYMQQPDSAINCAPSKLPIGFGEWFFYRLVMDQQDHMPEVIGIDHIYVTVSSLERSETFYDAVMKVLGFRKNQFQIDGEKHIQYYNRHFGYVLRPARSTNAHNPYAPGLHHFCLRVESEEEVIEAARKLKEKNITVSEPRRYPEYAPDYFAVFVSDPDGVRLEITNYRQERRERHDNWKNSGP